MTEIKNNVPPAAENQPVPSEEQKPIENKSNDILNALRPPAMPESLKSLDPVKIEKWDKMLKGFDKDAPSLGGMFQMLQAQHETMELHAAVLAKVAESSSKFEMVLSNAQKQQAEAVKIQEERVRTEKEFLAAHPEYRQPNQTQQVGGDMGGLAQILPDIIKLATNQANTPVSNPLMEKFNTYMVQKMDTELNLLMNPPKDEFADFSKSVVKDLMIKRAAKAVADLSGA